MNRNELYMTITLDHPTVERVRVLLTSAKHEIERLRATRENAFFKAALEVKDARIAALEAELEQRKADSKANRQALADVLDSDLRTVNGWGPAV